MDKLTLRLNKVNKLADHDVLKHIFACEIAISIHLIPWQVKHQKKKQGQSTKE